LSAPARNQQQYSSIGKARTALGVAGLAFPELLIEMEAIAMA
jgi:enamine deaminase RidA (YjgF/YER057c/UK114 family)